MKPVIGITGALDGDNFRLRHDYISAIENSGGMPVILPVCQLAAELSDLIDGLLLTGGADIPAYHYGGSDDVPKEYIKPERKERITFERELLTETLLREKPILAVCFGMQLLNVHHGGTLFQDIEYQLANAIDHRKGMHEIDIVDTFNGALKSCYTVNSSHHQAVMDAGDGLSVFAVAADGMIEGIYKRDYNFCVGVQWHPERIFYDPLSVWMFESLADNAAGTRRSRR
jgi:putative glutamine amidotransferase